MEGEYYSKETVDAKLELIHADVKEIKEQTTKTNGRVTKLEKTLLVVGCVTGTLLVANGSELVKFVMSII